jgi:hypothetical protein
LASNNVTRSLASDAAGNLYAAFDEDARILRYVAGDPSSGAIIAQGIAVGGIPAVALDPTESYLYLTTVRQLRMVPIVGGDVSVVADFPIDTTVNGTGIAIAP